MRKAITILTLILAPAAGRTQEIQVTVSHAPQFKPSVELPPLADPATPVQIQKYLAASGELGAYRLRWIAAIDKNRSLGAPYWPESFWTAIKERMQNADLLPMFTTWYQHTISSPLMQQVLDTYQKNGAAHFKGTPACFAFGEAEAPFQPEWDKLNLANTTNVIQQVYSEFKPQIKAARTTYMAAHPEYVDR